MKRFLHYLRTMVDSDTLTEEMDLSEKIDYTRVIPFILLNLAVISVFFTPFSWFAVAMALGSYVLRMFAITGFYHRYFSHKTFKTNRLVQFIFAFLGCASAQRGPLWWAGHHRFHHMHSDDPEDEHSPRKNGFWWSHCGWFMCKKNYPTKQSHIKDWVKYPELVFINRFDVLAPIIFGIGQMLLGWALAQWAPNLNYGPLQGLVWGFILPTVLLYHGTFAINSLAHQYGSQPFKTGDDSRNNLWLAIITLGEGWHNNHHHCANTAHQGFRAREIDPTYWMLYLMSKVGLVKQIRPIPAKVKEEVKAIYRRKR